MDTKQLHHKMQSDFHMKNDCWGVFARDELPKDLLPGGYIVNTDNKDKPGQHWIALWVEKEYLDIMDSLGNSPEYYGWSFNIQTIYNTKRLQRPESDACGKFCLYFLFYRCRHISMLDILVHCTENVVKDFIKVL